MMVADWGTTLMHHAPELRGEQRIAPAIAYGASAPQAASPRERLLWVQAVRKLGNCLKTVHLERTFSLRRACNGGKRPKIDWNRLPPIVRAFSHSLGRKRS